MIKKIVFLLALLGPVFGFSQKNERPNIIFILIDDMGYSDLSSFGNKEIQTPNIDRIAKEGIKFTNFYVASPICSPSRVALMTGTYPARYRIHSHLDSRESNEKRYMANYLDPKAPTIARMLKNVGYTTGHFGKWHMGGGRDVDDAPHPQAYGFDESLVSFEGLGDRLLEKGQGLSKASEKLGQGKVTWIEKWEKTGLLVDRTLDFVGKNKNKPFYVQLWTGDVHDVFKPNPAWLPQFPEYANDHYKQEFYAVLHNLDQQIGRLLDQLDKLKLTDNTLIILASDNGPTDWPFYYKQGFWPPGSADPFTGRKWSLYEGGIRVPFMARWPGHIPAGTVNETTILNSIDLLPTLTSIVKGKKPNEKIDGQDMTQALLGKQQQQRAKPLFWEYGRNEHYLYPGNPRFVSPSLAMRDGDWKLLMKPDGTGLQLYNLKLDHAETTNLAEKQPEIAKRMSEALLAWRKTLP
ncbi:MAG: sulfatase-like hydrolase/transferase [Rufibacter sp.]